jgi:2-dehydropantoate 2-reductase
MPPGQRAWDLVLLTVKAYDTTTAAEDLAPYLSPDTQLLIVQNGVGGEELARAVLREIPIISGVLTLSVASQGPGHMRLETTRGGLNLAPTREGQDVTRWAELFAQAGLRTATCQDHRSMKWSKLLLNIQANAIPAILDMTPREVFGDGTLFGLERSAFLEAWAVMRALGLRTVSFPNYPVLLLVWAMRMLPAPLLRAVLGRMVATGRGDKPPSLHMDLQRGRRHSEVFWLNGAVVEHAERLGLNVPVNHVLLHTLAGIIDGTVAWDEFRGQTQRLIAAVRAEGG